MIPLFARNAIFETDRCTRHTLEDFAKKTSKSMLKLVCFFYFQVVAVWIFPMVLSNFLVDEPICTLLYAKKECYTTTLF